LQQVNYWLKETTSGLERDGVRWIYNTNEQWLEQFPFWSESTLKRTFTRLKNGVLKVEQLNKSQRDMTNYYTINYESELLDEVKVTKSKSSKCTLPSGQNEPMEEVKVERSIGSKRTALIRSNCTDVLTENTTENTTDIKNLFVRLRRNQTTSIRQFVSYPISTRLLDRHTGRGAQQNRFGIHQGRLSENYSAEDLMLVVDYLTAKWADDPKMDDYLRPSTLFGPENCVEYFDKAQKWQKRGRPACVKGRWQLGGSADPNFKANFQNVDYSVPANSGFRVSEVLNELSENNSVIRGQ
jgi:uncharacterized phage protein (TIGR02220 family)